MAIVSQQHSKCWFAVSLNFLLVNLGKVNEEKDWFFVYEIEKDINMRRSSIYEFLSWVSSKLKEMNSEFQVASNTSTEPQWHKEPYNSRETKISVIH